MFHVERYRGTIVASKGGFLNNRPAWSRTPGSRIDQVDSRLTGALERAAEKFARENPGYTIEGFSGKKGRTSGTKNHPAGLAVDVNIIGPDGKPLGNVRNAQTFRTYEKFAQDVRRELDAVGLYDVGRWGGYFQQGVAFDQMHFDLGQRDRMAYGTWENGLNDAGKEALPGAVSMGMGNGTPNEMQAPLSLADTQLRDEAIARQAQQYAQYRPGTVPQPPPSMPSRPLSLTPDVALNKYAPPSRLAPVSLGKVTRAPLEALPASLPAAPVGRVERAPLGPVGQFAAPARSLQHPVSVAKPAPLAPAPVSPVTKGPALAPATPNAQTLAAQYAQYQPSKAVSMPTVAGMPSIPAPTGLPAAKPAQPLQHPVSVPATQAPPAAILAPALAPPKAVRDYPVADIPAAPAPTAYDVYSGLATQAKDNTGKNTVGMLPDGTTTVTNQWGVTTGMTPYGKQTAVGSLPGIAGPVKGALPGIAGSMLGGYLGGPLGAIAGGLLGKAFAPGGVLSGVKNIDTSNIPASFNLPAVTAFARPQSGLGFPSAPSGGYGSGGRMGASFSNRSRGEMASISPAAADAIGRGVGGLY